MSHFTVVVLVPQDKVPEPGHPEFAAKLEAVVELMLAPFDENLDVPSYQRACNCAKWTASRKAHELAVEETGLNIDMLRSSYKEESGITWADHIKPFTDAIDYHEVELMRDVKPDTDCSECEGTGFYESQYNPLSKWDWYATGGRWDGAFEENNIPTVIRNVAFAVDLQTAPYTPFAILSPKEPHQKQFHDNWNQKGQMGWFGMSYNENDSWPAIAFELFGKYNACFAVLMDLHI